MGPTWISSRQFLPFSLYVAVSQALSPPNNVFHLFSHPSLIIFLLLGDANSPSFSLCNIQIASPHPVHNMQPLHHCTALTSKIKVFCRAASSSSSKSSPVCHHFPCPLQAVSWPCRCLDKSRTHPAFSATPHFPHFPLHLLHQPLLCRHFLPGRALSACRDTGASKAPFGHCSFSAVSSQPAKEPDNLAASPLLLVSS